MESVSWAILKILAAEQGDGQGYVSSKIIRARLKGQGLLPLNGSKRLLKLLEALERTGYVESSFGVNGWSVPSGAIWRLTEKAWREIVTSPPFLADSGPRSRPSGLAERQVEARPAAWALA